jgi:alanyl-tRNA synthetase
MTERLYYEDSYLTEFEARIVGADGNKIYLDRTAFYPTSGGQPFDTGSIGGVPVVDVVDEGERIAHVVSAALETEVVHCRIDWPRRFDYMQQHGGQHLLSAVLIELFQAISVSVHFGADYSTVDVDVPSLSAEQIRAAECRANEVVWENRPLRVTYAENSQDLALRKASEREGVLRIVEIEGLDRSACGGTHVRSTGEIGLILLRKLEKIRGMVRLEFLCGSRALARARADFEALSSISRTFSSTFDDAPGLVLAQTASLKSTENERRRLAEELGVIEGRGLYNSAAPDAAGVRRAMKRLPSGNLDPLRSVAQGFCAKPMAVFVGVVADPPQLLVAASPDSGLDAGKLLKAALAEAGGRGGGSARMAQGSAPSTEALERAIALVTAPSASPRD